MEQLQQLASTNYVKCNLLPYFVCFHTSTESSLHNILSQHNAAQCHGELIVLQLVLLDNTMILGHQKGKRVNSEMNYLCLWCGYLHSPTYIADWCCETRARIIYVCRSLWAQMRQDIVDAWEFTYTCCRLLGWSNEHSHECVAFHRRIPYWVGVNDTEHAFAEHCCEYTKYQIKVWPLCSVHLQMRM